MKNIDSLSQFARRFSFEDWSYLSANTAFFGAVQSGKLDLAAVIAHELLLNPGLRLDPGIWDALKAREEQHEAARNLVTLWAQATHRTGSAHKQARQSRIRKLMKNGIDSTYARRLMAEAGMITE